MSLLQCSVFAHRVIVAADTGSEFQNAETGERVGLANISKLIAVAHMPALIAARGFTSLPSIVAGFAFRVPDFDTLIDHFAEQIVVSGDAVAATYPCLRASLDAEAELILAGWSGRAGRLRAFHAAKNAGERFTVREIYAEAWAPLPDADQRTRLEPQTTEDRVALARLQAARIRAESDGVAGGDLTIATLTRDAVSVEVVRDFTAEAAGTRRAGEAAAAGI